MFTGRQTMGYQYEVSDADLEESGIKETTNDAV
jgi:hypothetical protein